MDIKKRLFRNKYRVDTTRLKSWDYSWNGYYFITLCTRNRIKFFGKVLDEKMILNDFGKFTEKCWVEIPEHFPFVNLDEFIIMPEHMHGIIKINRKNKIFSKNKFGPQSKNIPSVIRGFKVGVVKYARNNNINFKWQDLYYDHVIRSEKALFNIREYIRENPKNYLKK